MKRLLGKITSCIIIAVIITSAVCINVFGYTEYSNIYTGNSVMSSYENNVFLLSHSTRSLKVEQIHQSSYAYDVNTNNDIYDCRLCCNYAIALCPTEINDQTEILIFDIYNNRWYDFYLNGYYGRASFAACCNGNVYVVSQNNDSKILKLSLSGKFISSISVDSNINGIFCDDNDRVFLCTNYGLYVLRNDNAAKMNNVSIAAPCTYLGSNIISDANGTLFKIYDGYIGALTITRFQNVFPNGGIIGNNIIVASNNTIYALDINSAVIKKKLVLDYNISQLCVAGNSIYITYKNSSNITSVDFSELKSISSYNDLNQNNNADNNTGNGAKNKSITSNAYLIDNDRMYIHDIPAGTTIAQFKKNVDYSGYSVEFYNHLGKQVKSGRVGTSFAVRFYNDNSCYEYVLSVNGDITGEGNVNTRDKKLMLEYLVDKATLSGVYFLAADKNNSGTLDTVDLILIMRAMENKNN